MSRLISSCETLPGKLDVPRAHAEPPRVHAEQPALAFHCLGLELGGMWCCSSTVQSLFHFGKVATTGRASQNQPLSACSGRASLKVRLDPSEPTFASSLAIRRTAICVVCWMPFLSRRQARPAASASPLARPLLALAAQRLKLLRLQQLLCRRCSTVIVKPSPSQSALCSSSYANSSRRTQLASPLPAAARGALGRDLLIHGIPRCPAACRSRFRCANGHLFCVLDALSRSAASFSSSCRCISASSPDRRAPAAPRRADLEGRTSSRAAAAAACAPPLCSKR